MPLSRPYLSYISTTLLGLLFLVSAFAKAWDAEVFAQMLLLYGSPNLGVVAPVIIMIEALLGTALLLRIHPRWAALAADCFLVLVSLIFAYGVLFRGITDCGCFGALSRLYTGRPWVTFVRNAVFLVISIPALREWTNVRHTPWWKIGIAVIISSMACFASGLSMRQSFELPNLHATRRANWDETMDKLNAVYPFSKDSTYFVYLFSFSCAYCQNGFANVEQYQRLHIADKVVGIAIEDAEARERFYRIYQPQIAIQTIPNDSMAHITGTLPVALFISGGKIQKAESGGVTSPGIFLP